MVQPLWKAVRRFPKTVKIEMPYSAVILPLGVYPKKAKTTINTVFIAELFTTAKIWRQPKCP